MRPVEPLYVLRLSCFDETSALQARSSRPIDDSGLSLDTRTGLPSELDKEALAHHSTWHIPLDLFDSLTTPRPSTHSLKRRLNPQAITFDPTAEREAYASVIAPLFEPLRPLDYRFGRVAIDWIDMPAGGVAGTAAQEAKTTGSIDVGFGVVHLYRDNDVAAVGEAGPSTLPAQEPCTILGVLAIPPVMSIADFLVFVQPAADSISQIRMIRCLV